MNSGITYGNFYSAWNGGGSTGYLEATLKGEFINEFRESEVWKFIQDSQGSRKQSLMRVSYLW